MAALRIRIVAGFGVLALGVAGLLLAPNWDATRFKLWPAPEDAAIRAVIRDGYSELQTAVVPANPVCPGPVPVTVQQEMLADLRIRLPRYFAGAALTRYQAVLSQTLSGESPACEFAGGVSAVDLSSVSVTGSSAKARTRITTWARVGQYQGNGRIVYAQPSGSKDCSIQLQKTDGTWLISDDRCTFPPGTGP